MHPTSNDVQELSSLTGRAAPNFSCQNDKPNPPMVPNELGVASTVAYDGLSHSKTKGSPNWCRRPTAPLSTTSSLHESRLLTGVEVQTTTHTRAHPEGTPFSAQDPNDCTGSVTNCLSDPLHGQNLLRTFNHLCHLTASRIFFVTSICELFWRHHVCSTMQTLTPRNLFSAFQHNWHIETHTHLLSFPESSS